MPQSTGGFNGEPPPRRGEAANRPPAVRRRAESAGVTGAAAPWESPPMDIPAIPDGRHVLIAGPTASGKSALALALAEARGGVIVNADALQVYANWRILTARPSPEDEARAPHALYGHVDPFVRYSVGHWLRDLTPLAAARRLIVTGGTGLYFRALTEGLAGIPPIPPKVRAESEARFRRRGLRAMAGELDSRTASGIDLANPARVRRAWEVMTATGRGLADWRAETGTPLLPVESVHPIVARVDRSWLNDRIDRRFDWMMENGALDEVRANLDIHDPELPSMRAIGAAELAAHLRGEGSLEEAVARAKTASRQYAKRQRTWFRGRMSGWRPWTPPGCP